MATVSNVIISTHPAAEYAVPSLIEEAAAQASKLLQENHEKHDIIFTNFGLHNHIVHHICTSYALGASPEVIQKNYNENVSYQRPPPPLRDHLAQELHDPKVFIANLHKGNFYPDYMTFIAGEIEKQGYVNVVNEYLFGEDERANIMFNRLYSGTLHPIIHLGFGIEFEQPAIVAEAIAQTAIHPTWLDSFFIEADQAAKQVQQPSDTLVNLLDEIRNDEKLSNATFWSDDNKVRDGVMGRAKDEMIRYASRWRVDAFELEEATAEMINACAYFTGAAQHPPKLVNFDFYFMHALTSSIFFSTFVRQPWITTTTKVKLLEWKGRLDLCQYASRHCPPLRLEEIIDYVPKVAQSDWNRIFERARAFNDDGHSCKVIRALAHGERVCAPYEGNPRFKIQGKMWLQLANMVMDSVEETGALWVRSAGFKEAWEGFGERSSATL